jgi:hypothetical protein
MDAKEIQALNDLQKALLSINGASRRLGLNTEEVVIVLPRGDFAYFKNVLESGNGSLAKFYIPVDDDSFKLSGITISRNKVEGK